MGKKNQNNTNNNGDKMMIRIRIRMEGDIVIMAIKNNNNGNSKDNITINNGGSALISKNCASKLYVSAFLRDITQCLGRRREGGKRHVSCETQREWRDNMQCGAWLEAVPLSLAMIIFLSRLFFPDYSMFSCFSLLLFLCVLFFMTFLLVIFLSRLL